MIDLTAVTGGGSTGFAGGLGGVSALFVILILIYFIFPNTLRLGEAETVIHSRLNDIIGGTGGQVQETQVPAGLHLDGEAGAAGSVVVAGTVACPGLYAAAADVGHVSRVGHEAAAVINGEPDIVTVGVGHLYGVGEQSIGRGADAIHRLGQVQVALAFVGSGKRGGVCVFLIIIAADLVVGAVGLLLSNGRRNSRQLIRVFHLDQHDVRTVNIHGVDGGGVQLPVVRQALRFGEGEVMARGPELDVVVLVNAHDALGHIDRSLPVIGIFVFIILADPDLIIALGGVAVHVQGDRFGGLIVQLVLPFLGHHHGLHGAGANGLGVCKFALAFLSGAGVDVSQSGAGVGGQIAILIQILLDVGIQIAVLGLAVL